MSRLPRTWIAPAVTIALLPALLLGGQVQAGANVGAASPMKAASVYLAAPANAPSSARVSVAAKKWTLLYSRSRSAAQAQTVWRTSASFRSVKRRPVARLQIRQIVNGRVMTARTKAVRTSSRWRKVVVSLKPARATSTVQVLVKRSGKARAAVRVSNVRVAAATAAVVVTPPRPAPAPLSGWGAPDWQDEFNGSAVDTAKWNVRSRSNLGLTIDAAIPEASQVGVKGGLLHLKGDWLPTTQTRTTSATGVNILTHKTGYLDQRKLKTGDITRSQRYGRWEIRAKTPTGVNTLGALAAFWLRNSGTGEIDIMEAWGYGQDFPSAGKVLKDNAKTTVFTDTSTTSSLAAQVRHKEHGSSAVPWAGFHTYAFELLPNRSAVVVDGKTIWTATPKTLPALWGPSFQTPLHMRLNLHIGPSAKYWGLPNPNNRSLTKPLDFQVDYVRTWAAPAS